MPWDTTQYLRFSDFRLRPAIDLLGRIDSDNPDDVYDLGAGAGNVTRMLKARWPDANVTGIDDSEETLRKAATVAPQIVWQLGDLGTWRPPHPADVIFANASLHWVDGHERLLPGLLSSLAPGGVLAIQMPRNFS